MSHAGKRVVLPEDRDDRLFRAALRDEGGLQAARGPRQRDALGGERVGERAGRVAFLERELRSRMDAERQIVEHGGARIDAGARAPFQRGGIHRSGEVTATTRDAPR